MEIQEENAHDEAVRPKIVVVGNEKGGTGKSTTAINLAVGFLYRGFAVGMLDLDPRQATISRYLENRTQYRATVPALPMPLHRRIDETEPPRADEAAADDAEAAARRKIHDAISGMADCDVVIVDTPGSPSTMSRAGHEEADVLVTPLNDSLVDIDVLAHIDPVSRTVVAPSFYCRMAWEYHNRRIVDGRTPIDWIVIRNRLPHVQSHNHRDVDAILRKLAQRIGFRLAPGLGERVVFRDLFLQGLTVLDLPAVSADLHETASQRAARLEIETLLDALAIERRSDRQLRRAASGA